MVWNTENCKVLLASGKWEDKAHKKRWIASQGEREYLEREKGAITMCPINTAAHW